MPLDRRGFLKFVAGGAVGTLLTPLPWKLTDDISIWTQNWPWIPRIPKGKTSSKPAVVKLGATEYGILINTVGDRPITVSGNPKHPLSQGGLDPLTAASVQLLYSPARIQGPLQRKGDGFESISWKEATDLLIQKLTSLKGKEEALACISGDETSSANEVLAAFVNKMGSNSFYIYPSDEGAQLRIWNDLMSGRGNIGYDLENSDFILSLSADVLESWGTVVRNQKVLSKNNSKLIYAGPVLNGTAAAAKKWIPVKPDAIGHLALAISYYILQQGHPALIGISGYPEFRSFVTKNYYPAKSSQKTGLPESEIKSLAEQLIKAKKPLIITGSLSQKGGSGFLFYSGMLINILLNRINKKGGIQCIPRPPKLIDSSPDILDLQKKNVCDYIQNIASGKINAPKVLFVYEANPAYALPEIKTTSKALKKIPFKVSFSPFMDETASVADLILPAPYFLERLDDSFTPFGSGKANYSITSPVIKPLTDSQQIPDLILRLSQKMNINIGIDSYESLLKEKAKILGVDWRYLTKGNAWEDKTVQTQDKLQIWNSKISKMLQQALNYNKNNKLILATSKDLKTGSPRIAIPPFCLKTIKEYELENNTFFVRINQETAQEYSLTQGSLVKVRSKAGECKAKVNIDEGVITNVVAVPLGFGHSKWDKFSRNKGDNAYKLFTVSKEKGSGLAVWSNTEVKLEKI